jgi:hypothetical protein
MKEASITEEESAAAVFEQVSPSQGILLQTNSHPWVQIEKSTREATSGHFISENGDEIPW